MSNWDHVSVNPYCLTSHMQTQTVTCVLQTIIVMVWLANRNSVLGVSPMCGMALSTHDVVP